jgi:oligosaccharide reducing-end xylanase
VYFEVGDSMAYISDLKNHDARTEGLTYGMMVAVPAFYEIWAEYAKDGHEQFYRDCADTARIFLHRACNRFTCLNSDYAEFSGAPRNSWRLPPAFRYNSWRVPMNIAMDYSWYGIDRKWQQGYNKGNV